MKYINFLPVFVAMVIAGCGSSHTLIDFNNLSSVTTSSPKPTPVKPGDSFKVGDTLIEKSSGVKIIVLPFQWDTGQWTDKGYVEVVQSTRARGSGNQIRFNNACLGIIAPKPKTVKRLVLNFGIYGGNTNLIENGQLHNVGDITKLSSPTVKIIVRSTPVGSPPNGLLGVLDLDGPMAPFGFTFPTGFPVLVYTAVLGGGQELWIDDLEFAF